MKPICCVFVIVCIMICLATGWSSALAQDTLTVTAAKETAKAGDLVQIPISIQGNSGIISVKVDVGYNEIYLSLMKGEEADFKGVTFSPVTNNPFTVNWMNGLQGNNTTNGVLAVLTFQVTQEIPASLELPITVRVNPKDVFDTDLGLVPFHVEAGAVTVLPQTDSTVTNTDTPSQIIKLGDVDLDGNRNAKDALAVLKASVGKLTLTPTQQAVADCNGDSQVNAKDALQILKFSVGKPSTLG